MRIRRRPPLALSPFQNHNLVSPQIQPPNNYARDQEENIRGLHQVGDLSVDPHPKQGFNEAKDSLPPSSSYKKASDTQVHNNERIEEEEIIINANSNEVAIEEVNNNGNKKKWSPAILMEGSRCSRVNGRGWRCSQQTLIGYSLCEHHLGKGRIRSIDSVARKPRKAREKIGVMKARSMSSLLDEGEDAGNMALGS